MTKISYPTLIDLPKFQRPGEVNTIKVRHLTDIPYENLREKWRENPLENGVFLLPGTELYVPNLQYSHVYETFLRTFDWAYPHEWAQKNFYSKGLEMPHVVWSYDNQGIFGGPVFFDDLLPEFTRLVQEKFYLTRC